MMKNLNIGIVIVAISLMLASCGNRTEQNSSAAERNQSDISQPATSSENNVLSELTSTDFPVSSAMAENNTTSQATAKTESSPISSKSNTASRTSSKANPSSRIPVSSSSTSSTTSNISAADSEWIADRVLELINAERNKLGYPALSTAPKAHEIATVRAKELTIKFSHDRPDGRLSGTVYNDFKYGECADYSTIIPKEEWGDYENLDSEGKSYGPGGSENICMTGTSGGTKEMAANNVYQMFKGSSAHWSDITNPIYAGVGIGIVVKYDKDGFDEIYCCILTMDRTYG